MGTWIFGLSSFFPLIVVGRSQGNRSTDSITYVNGTLKKDREAMRLKDEEEDAVFYSPSFRSLDRDTHPEIPRVSK